ncbi:hypothetical protein U0070_022837 [Myodes glareolus]|uniref:Uncharacterized protein n=1 Tax=Myodes glareolus TaxID=447135 RepID=A0AAW0K8I8_MYOGA
MLCICANLYFHDVGSVQVSLEMPPDRCTLEPSPEGARY